MPRAAAVIAALVAVLALPATAGADTPQLPDGHDVRVSARIHHSSPTLADIDRDGANELLVGSLDGLLHVIGADGQPKPGWPQPVTVRGVPTAVESTPTVADLDGDGSVEIVVGAGSRWVPDQHGGLVVFDASGSTRCRYQTADLYNVWNEAVGATPDGWSEGVMSTPAVGDITGDGRPEIVFGGWDNHVHALDTSCRPVPGFPWFQDDSVWSSPALYDVDHDGRLEIFVGGASSPGGPENWAGGVMRALDWRAGGVVVELWKQRIREVIDSSPAIGDINGDGRPEVIVGTGVFYSRYGDLADARSVHAWHLHDGSPVPGWPQPTGGQVWASPSLGDLDGDGRPEVVVGSRDGKVYAWKGNGTLLWSRPPNWPQEGGGEIISSAVIADLDGDGANDVAVGNGWATFTLRGRDGARLYEPLGKGHAFQNAPVVGRLGDGWVLGLAGMEMASGTGRIWTHPIPNPGATPPWPTWRKNSRHLGTATDNTCAENPANPCRASRETGRGYWVATPTGAVHAVDAPQLGSMAGRRLNASIVDMASTPIGDGYWLLGGDGGVFSFGRARFHGSTGGMTLNRPVVGLTATRSGDGYWVLGGDGGIFTYGDAQFHGSTGGTTLNQPVVGMARTPSGHGYWLVAADGGVFTYGDARFLGSTGRLTLNQPIIGITPTRSGDGYWLVAADGGLFAFGDARFHGSLPGRRAGVGAAGMASSPASKGYWILGADGRVFAFGDAEHHGDAPRQSVPPAGFALRP